MGAVESTTEETGVIRFIDDDQIRHEREAPDLGQDIFPTDFNRGDRDWMSHIPIVDDSHGIATVAPADTMLYEGTYDDFEIVGDTAIQTRNDESPEIANPSDFTFEEDSTMPTAKGLKYYRPPRRTLRKKETESREIEGRSQSPQNDSIRSRSVQSVLNSSSKLASLFGHDRASFTGGNESLTYTAPKQPKKEKPGASQSSSGETTLLCASAVHSYKYVNGQYTSQGKLGAAVLANHIASDYRILLYVSKQQQVTTAKIHGNFSLTVQGSNYASFYDDQRQTWSLCFDSENNIIDFAKQVGLSKFNSAPTSLCTQDLVPGDGLPIEVGDVVEVKYTGWLWTNNSFGKVFDGNTEIDKTFKFKTGKGKVIKGWEQGVVGMKKGGKRLIGIPSPLAYGEKGVPSRVPPNSSLLFEVEVLRIKSYNETGESAVTVQETLSHNTEHLPDILSEPAGTRRRSSDSTSQLSAPVDSGIKERTASLTEQLSQSPGKGTDKARLLARMSKMGKNPLSLPGAVVAEPEGFDADDTEQDMSSSLGQLEQERQDGHMASPPPISSNPHPNPKPKPQPPPRPAPVSAHPEVHQPLHNPAPVVQPQPIQQPLINTQPVMSASYTPQHQVALYQPPQPAMSMSYPMMPPQPQVVGHPYISPPQPPPAPPPQSTASDAMVPVLMAETRQQQGEVRMAIGKLSDKIDDLSNKVERHQFAANQVTGQITPAGSMAVPMAMGAGVFGNTQAIMEGSLLVHNITRIVQENEKFKAESAEKSKKIELLNDKISELLQKNQRFVEKSNTMLEQQNDSLQINSAQSQARLLSLEQERISMSGELTTAKTHLAALQKEVTALRQREAELSSQLSKTTSDAEKYKSELVHAKDSHTESTEETDKLRQNLKDEKHTRKRLESKVDHVEEELNDLRNEKESLERALSERKKKHTADKRKYEEEMEELRSQQEEEIRFLKEKHRKEKQSSGTVTAQQVSQAEAELEARWTEKADKLVAQTDEKWKRRFQEVLDEKEEAKRKLLELKEKYSSTKLSDDKKEDKIKDLQDKLEDLETLQEKYSRLQASQVDKDLELKKLQSTEAELTALQSKYQEIRSRTLKMKEQYEEQIAAAEEEHESALVEAHAEGLKKGKQQGVASKGQTPTGVADEVKHIMNTVFYMLKEHFVADESYMGSDIMAVILKTIKEVTMKLVAAKSAQKDESEEEEEDEEEDDEEEEEEEEEEQQKKVEEGEKQEKMEEEEQQQEQKEDQEKEPAKGKVEKEKMDGQVIQDNTENDKSSVEEEDRENEIFKAAKEEQAGEHVEEDKKEIQETNNKEMEEEQIEENSERKNDIDSGGPPVEVKYSADVLESDGQQENKEDVKEIDSDIQSDTFKETQIDVPSLDELSKQTVEEDSEIAATEDGEADTLSPSDEENETTGAEVTQEPTDGVEAEEKNEHAVEQPATQEDQLDMTQTESAKEDTFKSLFGDDELDDVEATFGSFSKKKEEQKKPDTPPLKEVPPPLFDDDDDDDLVWFK